MCANQRAADKAKVGLWLTPEEREFLEAVAKAHGLNMSDLIKLAIEKAAKEKGISRESH